MSLIGWPAFVLGSHLCREPMPPMAELKRDMENLRQHGFNLVKLQEHWQVDEPLEGHYDFSRYEELIEHAAKLEMGVYIGLTCEQAPAWLWRKHPDCRMVGRNGLPIAYEAQSTLPSDGKPGPCYDHPGARADMERFISRLVQILGRYENVLVWNTWQEIGYWAEGLVGQDVCYCEHTLAHFRRWLEQKYGDLDGLNRAWNTRYLDWSYVQPDRGARELPLPQSVDWRYFMANVQIASVLRARVEAIRRADPLRRPVFAHVAAPTVGAGRDWTYARCHDFVGSSCYPAWAPFRRWDDGAPVPGVPPDEHEALLAEMHNGVALQFDYVRSFNRRGAPIWAAEFQGGPASTNLHKGRVPSPREIRRWMLTAIGSGVTAISFWVTRAEIMAPEQNGFSLLDSEGESTPRYEEAARIGRALLQHGDLFGRPSWGGAPVGILVNEWNYVLCSTMAPAAEHLSYDVRGWHRLLWRAGIPVDFVELTHASAAELAEYRALVLPFPISLSEELAAKLARYVEDGGNLICEACPGRLSEHAFCRRAELSPTMRSLLGVRHESLAVVREPEGQARWTPAERTWGEFVGPAQLEGVSPLVGRRLRAHVYLETYSLEGAEPLFMHGEAVAGTVRAVGRGRAWLLGTLVGHSGTAYRERETDEAIRDLLSLCGVAPAHSGRLLLRRRVTQDKEAWLFTNPEREAIAEEVDVSGWRKVSDLLGEPLKRLGERVWVEVQPLDVRVLILER